LPLLPILEALPWEPGQASRLIEAVMKVDAFRSTYQTGVFSVDEVASLQMGGDSGVYRALLDFLTYSLLERMLEGNVLAEPRADILNKLCVIVEHDHRAFLGPFITLKQALQRRIIHAVRRTGGRSPLDPTYMYEINRKSRQFLIGIPTGDQEAEPLNR